MEAVEREISTPPEADDYAGRVKLTAYMAEKRLTVRGIAETLKGSGWPRCSGAAISMAARPSETGVQLVAQAFPVLYENFGAPSRKLVKRSHAENRAKPFRVRFGLRKTNTWRLMPRGATSARRSLRTRSSFGR